METYQVIKVGKAPKLFFALQSVNKMEIQLQATKYLKHRTFQHCSPNTIDGIARAIGFYYSFIEEEGITEEDVLNLSFSNQQEHFVKFLYWLKEGKHHEGSRPNNNTCNAYLSHVFGYYQFNICEYEKQDLKVLRDKEIGFVSSVGVRFRRSVKTFKGYLPKDNRSRYVEATEEMIETIMNSSNNLRFRLMIRLLFETGLRIGELLGIQYDRDIDLEKRLIYVTYDETNENNARAKYAENRHVVISEETYNLLVHYMAENRKLLKNTHHLFINQQGENIGKPMTVKAVYSELDYAFKKTGVKITPHMLRHYFANERRKANWRLELISEALGHKHITTTMQYLHIMDEELQEASEAYFKAVKTPIPLAGLV